MKKFSAALLIALWALYGVACAALPDQDIVILYTNDVHCGVGGAGGRMAIPIRAQAGHDGIPLSFNILSGGSCPPEVPLRVIDSRTLF